MRPFIFLSLAICTLGRVAAAQSDASPTTPSSSPASGRAPEIAPPKPETAATAGQPAPDRPDGASTLQTTSPTPSIRPTYARPEGNPPRFEQAPRLDQEPRADPLPPDARSHRGFFLRMALGGGYVATSTQIDSNMYGGKVEADGRAFAFEIDIGGAISPGFILAGSYSVHGVGDASLSNDTRLLRVPHDTQLTLLSAMVDLYPNPKEGFHFGGGLGLATTRLRADEDALLVSGQNGVGITPHVGYEWWLGNYWGLGVLGRFIYARTKGNYADGYETDRSVGASILFSATYN